MHNPYSTSIVLLVSAHADDALIGAGGYAFKLQKCGAETCHIVFTLSEKDNGVGFTADELKKELETANKVAGFNREFTFKYPVHYLPQHGAEIRSNLEDLRDKLHPKLILIPSVYDTHQDHHAVAEEAIRTFRNHESVLSYEVLRGGAHHFNPTFFVDITDEMDNKLKVLSCFNGTQSKRPYMNVNAYLSVAGYRGIQIGAKYAEAFEAVKMVL